MQNVKIEIPKPCSEDWDKMKIGLNKRFCENCQKNVIDFTQKNRIEILSYLLMNKGTQTCGRINKSQLDFYHEDIFVTIQSLSKSEKSSNLPFYILTIGSLILAGCNPSENPKSIPTENIVKVDSVNKTNDEILNQNINDSNAIDSSKNDKKSCDKNSNKKSIDGSETGNVVTIVETGEIAIEPEPEILTGDIIGKIAFPDTNHIYEIVEIMPEFIGGIDSLKAYMTNNLIYPEYEKNNHIEGTVYVNFVIEKDGEITNPKILKSVKESKNFDTEVLRIINQMPNWKPGEMNGKKVAVKYNLPVRFNLRN